MKGFLPALTMVRHKEMQIGKWHLDHWIFSPEANLENAFDPWWSRAVIILFLSLILHAQMFEPETFLHMFLAKLSVLLIKLRYIFPLAAPFFRHIST